MNQTGIVSLPAVPCWSYRKGKSVLEAWTPPAVRGDATTNDLAAIHHHFRKHLVERNDADVARLLEVPVSVGGITQLLRQAFLASLVTNELRPTTGNLYVINPADPPGITVFSFAAPKPPLSKEVIAGLSQTLVSDDAALLVEEEGGQLVCKAIAHLASFRSFRDRLLPGHHWSGVLQGVLVSMLGPGHIRLRHGICDFTLQANNVKRSLVAAEEAPVRDWLLGLHRRLLQQSDIHDSRRQPLEDDPAWCEVALSTVLRSAAHLHHGGTLLVLADPDQAPFASRRFPGKGESLWHRLAAVYAGWLKGKVTGTDFEYLRDALLRCASAAGELTGVDGCVVFDRWMRLEGFGWFIDYEGARQQAHEDWLPIVDRQGQPLAEEEMLRHRGTRHRSAFYLCKACRNSMAFVLSQDGDLRAYCNDGVKVHYLDDLSP